MQLQNFECQIAKAQIGRYVAGDALSEETVQQLEAHIAKCPDCKQNLAERRAALQAMLTAENKSEPEATEPAEKKRFDIGDLIRAKIAEKVPAAKAKPEGSKAFTKPALYSAALGVVLIGMSYASRNMESMLGPKATTKAAADEPAKPVVKAVTPPPQPTPKKPDVKPTADDTPPQSAPAKVEEPKPKPNVAPPEVEISSTPAPTPKRETKRKRSRSKHTRKSDENVIRVYEPEN